MSAELLFAVAFAALLIPIATAIVWVKKYHGKAFPILVGIITFFVFANVLENLLHMVCLMVDNPVSRFLNGNTAAYVIYGAFAAGIFEETGRYAAFRIFLREENDRRTAVSYGIGHGGVEVILTLFLNYLVMGLALMAVGTSNEDKYAQIIPAIQTMIPGLTIVALLERTVAMLFHIGASVLVFAAAKDKRFGLLYPAAIVLHAVMDIPAALYQRGILSIGVTEAIIAAFSLVVCFVAGKIYKKIA